MQKIKCVLCGKSEVYASEKEAYLDGWYWSDGSYRAEEICPECQVVEKQKQIQMSIDRL